MFVRWPLCQSAHHGGQRSQNGGYGHVTILRLQGRIQGGAHRVPAFFFVPNPSLGHSLAILALFGIVLATKYFIYMVIRMRHTRSHTKNRRSHHALTAPALATCAHCGATHRPHHMCLNCGYYNGRQVMDLEAQKQKRDARLKAKRDMIRTQAESVAVNDAETVAEAKPAEEKK